VITGKAVWSISIDVTLINNGGNLIDACYLASLLGLLNFRKPFIKIENESEIKIFSPQEKKPLPLSITHIPISFTYGFFSEANQVISDPTVRIENKQ
jgi:exosome complex RNA-binding protein Rrp42 (RNase PH superfamily)